MHPFWDETVDFCNYLTYSVNKRLLKLLSKVLELDDTYLWDRVQSKVGPVGQGYFRQALYYATDSDLQVRGKGMRMNGYGVRPIRVMLAHLSHADFGTTTMLFSVPVSSLQIWGRDEQWYYVPYTPGALVINIGETLERGSYRSFALQS
jgi:isopenicillin N synthase-like dioxygenase